MSINLAKVSNIVGLRAAVSFGRFGFFDTLCLVPCTWASLFLSRHVARILRCPSPVVFVSEGGREELRDPTHESGGRRRKRVGGGNRGIDEPCEPREQKIKGRC